MIVDSFKFGSKMLFLKRVSRRQLVNEETKQNEPLLFGCVVQQIVRLLRKNNDLSLLTRITSFKVRTCE
jgi:hypothetical protein